MIKGKKPTFFWQSYSDVMMSLFFVMFVLFVVTYMKFKKEQDRIIKKTDSLEIQLKKINEIEEAVKNLPKDFFSYQSAYKRFTLKRHIQFDKDSFKIKSIYHDFLLDVGKTIRDSIDSLKLRFQSDDIKYMIVIEGMASKDRYSKNDQLSYERALSLFYLWKENGIEFDPNVCEIQIAGSGIRGIGRREQEELNQRFLIQIIPKVGKIDYKK